MADHATYTLSLKVIKSCAGRSHSVSSDVIDLRNVDEVEQLIEQLLKAVRGLPNGAALNHNYFAGAREGIN